VGNGHLLCLWHSFFVAGLVETTYNGFWVIIKENNVVPPFFLVGGPELVHVDLFDSLNLHNSTYKGVSLGTGVHLHSPGVTFTGKTKVCIF